MSSNVTTYKFGDQMPSLHTKWNTDYRVNKVKTKYENTDTHKPVTISKGSFVYPAIDNILFSQEICKQMTQSKLVFMCRISLCLVILALYGVLYITKEWPAHGTNRAAASGDSATALASTFDHAKLFKSNTFSKKNNTLLLWFGLYYDYQHR